MKDLIEIVVIYLGVAVLLFAIVFALVQAGAQ